ncbi:MULTISPECIES: hypothetical protein [unclassified Sphingobacterium]|uniref:hypothetical protein n=1 Tax=unclassified Sphingobacterium TaxID=2609468 RepID=UPI001048CD40|nr:MULTISPECIES: hypothetical protein [unclassified Sphingobacterium]MCS3557628.1 hypothetical protein [Sphingobacterium sp. JUb21]
MMIKKSNGKFFILVLSLIFTISCRNPLKETLRGNWIIESMSRDSADILHTLEANMLSFHENGECSFARTDKDRLGLGSWCIFKDTLVIDGGVSPFSGRYLVKVRTDDDEVLIYLRSVETNISATKMLFSF